MFLLDLLWLSVYSQVVCLQVQVLQIEEDDVCVLCFEFGWCGYQVLQVLCDVLGFKDVFVVVVVIDVVLVCQLCWYGDCVMLLLLVVVVIECVVLQCQFVFVVNSLVLDIVWWDVLFVGKVFVNDCLWFGYLCVVVCCDLDGDGCDEMLLCDVSGMVGLFCQLYVLEGVQWCDGGIFIFWVGSIGCIQIVVCQGNIMLYCLCWLQVLLDGGELQDIQIFFFLFEDIL